MLWKVSALYDKMVKGPVGVGTDWRRRGDCRRSFKGRYHRSNPQACKGTQQQGMNNYSTCDNSCRILNAQAQSRSLSAFHYLSSAYWYGSLGLSRLPNTDVFVVWTQGSRLQLFTSPSSTSKLEMTHARIHNAAF